MSQNDSKGKISSQKYCQIWTQQGQLSLYLLPNLGQALLSQAINCAVSVLKLIKFEDWSCPLFWIAEFVFENVCGALSCGGFRAVSQKKNTLPFRWRWPTLEEKLRHFWKTVHSGTTICTQATPVLMEMACEWGETQNSGSYTWANKYTISA